MTQSGIIEKVKSRIQEDDYILAAYMNAAANSGSEENTNAEFFLFTKEGSTIEEVDWVKQIESVHFYAKNDAGGGIAVFKNLFLGEFHFLPASQLNKLNDKGIMNSWVKGGKILADKTGELTKALEVQKGRTQDSDSQEKQRRLLQQTFASLLKGSNWVLQEDLMRAREELFQVHWYLFKFINTKEDALQHWEQISQEYQLKTFGLSKNEVKQVYCTTLVLVEKLSSELSIEIEGQTAINGELIRRLQCVSG